MTVATRLKHFLDLWKVNYMVSSHQATATLSEAAHLAAISSELLITGTVLLIQYQPNKQRPLLCVHRLDDKVDIQSIANFYGITSEQINFLSIAEVNYYFDDCEPGVVVPFGEPYGIFSIIDSAIKQLPYVYFTGGGLTSLVRLCRDDFIYLSTQSGFVTFATKHLDKHAECLEVTPTDSISAIQCVKREESWLEMPDYLASMIEMAHNHVGVDKFESYLRQHVVFYPLFYPGVVRSKRDSFSMISHVGVKIAGRLLFTMNRSGPLGLSALWQDSLYAAELSKQLSTLAQIPKFGFSADLAYCCGLFHHFGYLIYGHLYTPEFNLLNRQWEANQDGLSICSLEQRILTFGQDKRWLSGGHAKMGASLLSYWQANPVIVTVAEFHHQANYHGFASEYVWLVYFADQLLAYFKRGDGSLPIEGSIAKKLGLSINESIEITRKILTNLHSDVTSGTASSYSQ